MDRLQLSDEDTEVLWDSPSKHKTKRLNQSYIKQESSSPVPRADHEDETLFDQQEAREAALRSELQSLRNINQVIESLLGSLDRAKGNMEVSDCPTNRVTIEGSRLIDATLDCFTDHKLGLDPTQHLDAYSIANGT
jgi:outer membrane translocation and assembly module TamA